MPDSRLLLLGVAAVLAACAPASAADAAPVPVTVTARGCEPMALTVPAGRVTFLITNRSSRALEWEILKGVMIVDERENIAPGFKQRLTTTLVPGEYEVTCGLLSNPRGRLTVVNAEGGITAAAARPGVAELIGLSAEYRVWTLQVLADLAKAVAGKDRTAARAALLHLAPLERLAAPQAQALQAAISSPEADLAVPAADYAVALRALSPAPQVLIEGLAETARRLAIADPADAAALLAAIVAPTAHLLPLVRRADPAVATALDKELGDLAVAVQAQSPRESAGAALATDLARLPAVLGLS
jgi:hypothetical protein